MFSLSFRRWQPIVLLPLAMALIAWAAQPESLQPAATPTPPSTPPASQPMADSEAAFYADYAAVLTAEVKAGLIDYAGLKARRAPLDRFVAALAVLDPQAIEAWNEPRRLAFWINAYNALTLTLIIDRYPIESSLLKSAIYPRNSIRQIGGAWDKIAFTVAGQTYTLDQIEHAIIRKQFHEPRVHMALVCAALSCPDLRGEPYLGQRLDEQLASQSRLFLSQPKGLQIANDKLMLSAIFDWFKDDFKPREGEGDARQGLLQFVKQYGPPSARALLERQPAVPIGTLDYDWSLNEQPRK